MAPCFVCFLVILISSIIFANASIDCVSVTSSLSGTGYQNIASVECPNTHTTMVSCGFRTFDWADVSFGGSWIDDSSGFLCLARNIYGSGVFAEARCCNFDQTVSCKSYDGTTADGDDALSLLLCDSDYPYMLGCTGFTLETGFDGMYAGSPNSDNPKNKNGIGSWTNPTLFEMKNSCNAQNGQYSDVSGTKANINCCSADIGLDCKLVYRDPTSGGILDCPSGYTMMACMASDSFGKANAWYIEESLVGNDDSYQCNVGSVRGTGEVYASAICCAETTGTTQEPTGSPTLAPSLYPTDAPSNSPTIAPTNEPTAFPSNNPSQPPTQDATTMPSSISPTSLTSGPTPLSQSVAETYSDMMFSCQYNDESITYYTVYITLSQYAQIMIDAILETVQSVTFHSANYNDGDVWQFAEWTRSGIFDFKICSLFDGVTINECSEIESIQSNNANAQYSAIGTFGIMADQSIEKYKEYIIDAMMSDNFLIIFESNMNNKLNQKINANQPRRRLLQTQNDFDAVSIKVVDSLSDTQNAQNDENGSISSSVVLVIVVIGVIFLLMVIISLFVYRKRAKNKSVSKNVELGIKGHNENDGEKLNEPFVEEEDMKNNDIVQIESDEFGDDDLVNSINKLNETNGNNEDDNEIVDAVNVTFGKNEEGNIALQQQDDDNILKAVNETLGNEQQESEGMIAVPNDTMR